MTLQRLINDLSGPMGAWAFLWVASFVLLGIIAFRNASLIWAFPPAAAVSLIGHRMSRYDDGREGMLPTTSEDILYCLLGVGGLVLVYVFLRDFERRNRRNGKVRDKARSKD